MTTNRRRTNLLSKGCLLIFFMEFAVWTSVLATAPAVNSSRNSSSIKTQSGSHQKQYSNVTTPEKNATTMKVANQKTTTTTQSKSPKPPTTKAITFLDDYGELPGVSYDYDDDDDTLTTTTTVATTVETLRIHEAKEVNLLFEMVNPHLEYNVEGNHVGEKKSEAVATSLTFDAHSKDVNIAPVHRQRRSQDLPELVPNPAQLAIDQLLFTDGGSGEVTDTTEVTTTTITETITETTTAPTTTATITTNIATTTAPTTTAAPTTRTSTTAARTTATSTSATRTSAATTQMRTTTTPIPPRTTSPPILETKPPNIDPGDSDRILYFLIVIIIPFTNDLYDHRSPIFIAYSREIEIKVDIAYRNCPGYRPNSVVVTNFRRSTSNLSYRKYFLALNSAIEPLQTETDTINSTIADYNVTFETATVYQQPDEIISYIKDTVTPLLESTTIANSTVIAPENQYLAHTQIKNMTKAPCQDLTCDPCYVCREDFYSTNSSGNDTYTRGTCHYTCNLSNQRCTIIDNTQKVWKGQCSCIAGYLPVGNGCTDERIVIGVSVGVASVLLLAFVIVVVILCCNAYRKKKKHEDSDSETSYVDSQTVDNGRRLIAEQGVPNTPALNQYTTENAASTSGQMAGNGQPRRTSLPLIIFSDEDGGNDDLPPEITQSEAFVNFVPNLGNVDDSKLYTIPRPNVSTASLHSIQSTNYDNSFFF